MNKSMNIRIIKRYDFLAIVLSALILFLYLLAIRLGFYLPTGIFWVSVFLIITISVYKVITTPNESSLFWIFPVIVITVWLLKTIFIPVGVPFFGSDPYIEQTATGEIARLGWIDLSPWKEGLSRWSNSTNYPFLSILSISLTQPIGLSSITWARWAMPAISLISLLFIFGISMELYQSIRVALLSTIGFGFTYMYLMFHSLYLRESLAFIFFLGTVYTFIKGRSTTNQRPKGFYRICCMVFILAIILSHHFTSLLLLLFGLLVMLVYRVRSWYADKHLIEPETNQWGFASVWVFFLVALLTYWVYLRMSPIGIVQKLLEDALSGGQATSFSLPATARYYIVLFNQINTTFAFGVLAVAAIFNKNNRSTFQLTSIGWGILAGFGSLFFAVAGIPGTSSLSSRFELYGYAFLIPAASFTVIQIYQERKWLGVCLGLIFILYGLNSIYRFPPYLYSQKQPDFLKREVRLIPLHEEYNLIKKLNPRAKIASDLVLNRWIRPITDSPVNNWFSTNPFADGVDRDYDFDFLVVGERELFLLSSNYYGRALEDLRLSKIYSAGRTAIYIPVLNDRETFNIDKIVIKPPREENEFLYPWTAILLMVEIVLFVVSAYLIALFFGDFYLGNLGIGFGIAVIIIFLIYLFTNIMGYKSPGLFLILSLMVIILGGIKYSKTRNSLLGKNNLRILTSVCMMSIFMFGYGVLVDSFPQNREYGPYTEFYVQSISPCDQNLCISLRLTNYEGNRMNYQIEGFSDQIKLNIMESWEGMLVVPQGSKNKLCLNLLKSPKTIDNESLILQVNNSFQ